MYETHEQQMENLKKAYKSLCEDQNIDSEESVLLAISRCGSGFALDLSTSSISAETCIVLGKLLTFDHNVTEVNLCDTMVPTEGLKAIIQGLSKSNPIKIVDFKGNNIRGQGAEALGQLLRHSQTITKLCLEWNALGLLTDKFQLFTEGLAVNTTLKELDLRNNQINHHGACDLANALKRNVTLENLDLRWNNIGLLGSKALLEAVTHNKVLSKLDLTGNNIPLEILQSIESAISNNVERNLLKTEQLHRTQRLTEELRNLEEGKNLQLNVLMDKIEKKDEEMSTSNRKSLSRISQLQEVLTEKNESLEFLSIKIEKLQTTASVAEAKNRDLSALLKDAYQDNSDLRQQHHEILSRERKERVKSENKLLDQIKMLSEKHTTKGEKLEELQKSLKQKDDEIEELTRTKSHLEKQMRLSELDLSDQIELLKERHKEMLKEVEEFREKDVQRIRSEAMEIEKGLRERIMKSESQRLKLEEEMTKLNLHIISEKAQNEDVLMSIRQKLKAEQAQKSNELEEKIRLLEDSKNEQEKVFHQQSKLLSELRSKNTALTIQLENMKLASDHLEQNLLGKEEEMKVAIVKVRLEMKEQLDEFEICRQENSILKEKISNLTKESEDALKKNEEILSSKDKDTNDLKMQLERKDEYIKHIQEDEARRAASLHNAFMTYLHGVKCSHNNLSS